MKMSLPGIGAQIVDDTKPNPASVPTPLPPTAPFLSLEQAKAHAAERQRRVDAANLAATQAAQAALAAAQKASAAAAEAAAAANSP